ncbi:MAG: CHAD domain-containing protein [Candidatus Eremiobacteraeota bacterium]|nr:CHAD domain-containing protein [Candidatus Eremiobacteraeota bacterium]MBV9277670.1 CHAD domain-containing protein [Candidatus Eremiobacteraeota bacterium]
MRPPPDVVAWANTLVSRRIGDLKKIQRKARKHWRGGEHVHKLRTHARRLRAAVEDLRACIANAQQLIDASKELGQKTGKVRDADVLVRKLRRYRVFALPAERAEIDTVCKPLLKERKAAQKPAKGAVDDVRFKAPK